MIYRTLPESVGGTPIVELRRVSSGLPGLIAGKLEARNPGGSVKDRIGLAMVEDAERRGALKPGATIVEATSGNTGIALAWVAASKGYSLVVTMPETMSRERISLLRHLGAKVELTPGAQLMRGAVQRAQALLGTLKDAVMLDQFKNPANPEVHKRTTALEILADVGDRLGAFVAGVGTGGTITGVGEVLKERAPTAKVIAVEPSRCPVLSGGAPGHHLIQGIGAGFVPAILNRKVIDEVVTVTDEEAFSCARRLAREEGICAGISCGAALAAALKVAARPEMEGKVVLMVLPDSGERYVTSHLMDELAKPE